MKYFFPYLITKIDLINDSLKYLLNIGLDLNQTHTNPYSNLQLNITVFNKIIYRMCEDLDYMWDHDYDHDEWQIGMKHYTEILKIFFNHSPIFPNKGSPTLYEILDMFPNIKFAMIQILDDASFDVETFKSKSRLAFAKSGLAPSIIDSILTQLILLPLLLILIVLLLLILSFALLI